ncbi:MAG: VOC family protein [Acidimicrobiia bacterium]
MPDALELLTLSHLNAIVDGYDSAVDHFVDVLGASLNMEIPDDGEVRACLISLGGVLYELFAPNDRTAERGQGRLLGKFGDHYLGAEYAVPDVPVARERCAALGVRIINDRGSFFFTYPGTSHGVAFELWDEDWHDLLVEGNERYGRRDGRTEPMPSKEYWRDEHPLGLTGLVRIGSAVEDLDAAVSTFTNLVGAPELYRADRPAAAARAVGLRFGDTVVELLAPTGPGPVRDYLDRYGERFRSTVYGVVDLDRVEKHFAERGIPLVAGDAPGVLAIPPDHNHKQLFEFSEEPSTHPR